MTRQDIVREISNDTGITMKEISTVLDAFQETIKKNIVAGEKIQLTGFMTFMKTNIPAKSGVSKLNGIEKAWETPAHDEVKVALSKSYKAI